ncbi:carboxylesterase family protein [Subtercola lobariae]|uniref:Carboxylic ester hydrolase n=1 Tax=Subtercola lobariae TaxID=1588641 RepID=A0A917B725_9MICO|nr:carboxylesterase family protein [Subtercola lobariae]GGF29015.1 carboxylesterase [Subtercola lobariae]
MGAPTTVVAPAGTIVGRADGGVRRFLGIPFAETPTGPFRFERAVRRGPLGVFDAGFHGATPQRIALFETTTIPEPSIAGDDILTLSVVAPEHGAGPLPVLVWMHGGGFLAGSPASPWYDGRSFARDGVVVVTLSYRLGIEGFAPLEGGTANLGLWDLLLGLEWVRDNIEAFGGDPARVTIAGQSAGGGAVLALLASPLTAGLFSAAISVSGGDFAFEVSSVHPLVERVAAHVGVPATREGFCTVSDEDLQRAMLSVRQPDEGLTLGPTIGDELVPESVTAGLARFNLDVPLLLGATGDEFDSAWSAEEPDRPVLSAEERAAARAAGSRITDSLFRSAVPRVARARAGADTWSYTFEWPSPLTGGSSHCIDLPFFFDVLDAPGVTEALGENPPAALARDLHADMARFVTTGAVEWPRAAGELGDSSRLYSAEGAGNEVITGAYDPVTSAPQVQVEQVRGEQ